MGLRDDILAYDDKPIAGVIVKEWNNAKVFLRMLLASERDSFDKETVKRRKKDASTVRVRERLVILCAQDENGAPLFKADDEGALANKSNAAIDKLFRVACKHNGFIEEDEILIRETDAAVAGSFQVILSLSIGKSLEEIRRMTAKDVARYRRFYNVCPFGPARLDLNAWLTAQHVWAGWNGKTRPMEEAVLWFGKQKKRNPPKRKPPPGNIGRMMVEAAIAAGEKVTFLNPDGTVKGDGENGRSESGG